jgi:CheY-like chemotaxis protein
MLGHELRNPLSPIITATQLMRMRGKDGHELDVIERQLAHLVRLVDDLLDISRITRGKIELRKEHLELASAVLRGVEMASPLLEQRRQELELQVPAEGLAVEGDPDRLGQIVSNLLTNAAKYSEPGSKIHVSAARAGGIVRLRVVDSGIGIPAEMLDRIFDSFVQQPQALDRSKGGLGLGLAIVRSLVELHGGAVRAHSDGPGRGAEFVVELPVAPGVDASESLPPRRLPTPMNLPPISDETRKRILVVDDNQDAAASIAELLMELGHEVRVAYDGPGALRLASTFKPNVCLLDIGLPLMDGYEVAQRLRQSEDLPVGVRMIAITGYGQDADRRRSREAGFNAHVVKPIDLDDLTKVVAH